MFAAQEPWMFQPSIHVGWIWRYGDPHDTTAKQFRIMLSLGIIPNRAENRVETTNQILYIYMIYGVIGESQRVPWPSPWNNFEDDLSWMVIPWLERIRAKLDSIFCGSWSSKNKAQPAGMCSQKAQETLIRTCLRWADFSAAIIPMTPFISGFS